MCFSVKVEKDIKKTAKLFNAKISGPELSHYQELKIKSRDLDFVREQLNLSRKPSSTFFKEPHEDGRVYPGYFAWVMVSENGQRVFKKMRYRIRPAGSKKEIPSKFNVFNARQDSLDKRRTWKRSFMRTHGLFPFLQFYEWVERRGKKKLISFIPEDRKIMWAPCLWEYWENEDKTFDFYSFAIVTDDPPTEISDLGHDRCPVFLKEHSIDAWLNPQGQSKEEIMDILKDKIDVYYQHSWAA